MIDSDSGPEQGVNMGELVEPSMRPKYQKEELFMLINKYETIVRNIAKQRLRLQDPNISNK